MMEEDKSNESFTPSTPDGQDIQGQESDQQQNLDVIPASSINSPFETLDDSGESGNRIQRIEMKLERISEIITRIVEKSEKTKTDISREEQFRFKESTPTTSESVHGVRPKHKKRELERQDVSRFPTQSLGEPGPSRELHQTIPSVELAESGGVIQKNVNRDEIWTGEIKNLVAALKIPQESLPTFSGHNRKEFRTFLLAFNQYLNDNVVPPSAKLQMLIRSCRGTLKETLQNFVMLGPIDGYAKAMEMLKGRLGGEQDYLEEMTKNLIRGPTVRYDKDDLQTLKDQIWDCKINMDLLECGEELNNYVCVSLIADRFTGKLRDKYDDALYDCRKKGKRRPGIEWLKTFVTEVADRVQNKGSSERRSDGHKVETQSKKRNTGLATVSGERKTAYSKGSYRLSPCPICPGTETHPLPGCPQFRVMSVSERYKLVSQKGLCYTCLKPDHVAYNCKTWLVCGINGCQQKHSRWLHSQGEEPFEKQPVKKELSEGHKQERNTKIGMTSKAVREELSLREGNEEPSTKRRKVESADNI